MKGRLGALAAVVVILAAGAFLGSAYAQWWGRTDGAPGPRSTRTAGGRVRVGVLNGGGVSGLAADATNYLRDEGFDVVDIGNEASFGRDSSVVLDRVGDVAAARAVADALGIRIVRSEPDSNLYLDVSVLLGSDWRPPGGGEDEPVDPPWWDPRGWWTR
jgi:LytR cell envelope-related transcriptional attenuator